MKIIFRLDGSKVTAITGSSVTDKLHDVADKRIGFITFIS